MNNIAIAIVLVDELLNRYTKSLKILREKDINFIYSMQEIGHITLCIGNIKESDIEKLILSVAEFLDNEKSFSIETNGIGIFFNKDINFHIRWKVNSNLIKFRKKLINHLKSVWKENIEYNIGFNWIAKTSLAYKDIELADFLQLDFIKNKFLNEKMVVKELCVIQYEEGKKEKILKKYKIKGN